MPRRAPVLPETLRIHLQEYDLDELDVERDAVVIIDRALEHGDRSAVRWMFRHYGVDRVREQVRHRGARQLTPRAFAFWRLVLDIDTWRPHPWPEAARALWRFGG